jgi:hypothetical protein
MDTLKRLLADKRVRAALVALVFAIAAFFGFDVGLLFGQP